MDFGRVFSEAMPLLLEGLKLTVITSLVSIAIGMVIGLFVCLMKMSKSRILRAISGNQTSAYSNLDAARSASRNCSSGSPIVLTSSAVLTYPGGQRTLGSGAVIRRSDFAIYNGFMTPAAWNRHGFSTANKHTCTYLGHIYYVTKEVW